MMKSDLRSGMLVTLRNKNTYYVMLNTGLVGDQNDVLVNKVNGLIGWMPLRNYDEDMQYHDDPDLPFPNTEDEDRSWDIVQVEAVYHASSLCERKYYKTIWKEGD